MNKSKVLVIRPHSDLYEKLFDPARYDITVLHDYSIHNMNKVNWITFSQVFTIFKAKGDFSFAKNLFDTIWRKNKSAIQYLLKRQLYSIERNSQLKDDYYGIVKICYQYLSLNKPDLLMLEINPHQIVDFLVLLLAQELDLTYFYFNSYAYDTLHLIHTGKATKELMLPSEIKNHKIELLHDLALKNKLLRKVSPIIGGTVLWNSSLIFRNKGEYRFQKPNILNYLIIALYYNVKINKYKHLLQRVKKSESIDIRSKDIVVYLHFQPESSTVPIGGKLSNMLALIYLMARRYPNKRVHFKEHPAMMCRVEKRSNEPFRFRDERWLKKITRLPNLFLTSSSTEKILERKPWVVSINGTVIFENEMKGGKSIIINNRALEPYLTRRAILFVDGKLIRGKAKYALTIDKQPKDVLYYDYKIVASELTSIGIL